MLAVIPSVGMTLFFGIGSIMKNNAGELPNQMLPVRTDGCYINETITTFADSSPYSMKQNVEWKDETYTTLTKVLSISYLWQPVITIVGTVVFGLLFSLIINMFQKSPKVKSKLMTPIILSMWKKILGVDKLSRWIDFDDHDEEDNHANEDAVSERNSIASDSLYVR